MTKTLLLARKLVQLNKKEAAMQAYFLALEKAEELEPQEELEAASYIFFAEGDYKISFTTFVSLYNRGLFQADLMNLMMQAFYLPNVQKQKKLYERNCRALGRYSYLFQKDFPAFDTLPILFFPFDDKGYVPYFKAENRFGEYVNFDNPVIDRYFFQDLENPILAKDVYSQYQLEYLYDNVRKSEWVGRENHIYLHYTDWMQFCAYLQCLDFSGLLKDKKFVFLMEDEISQYPIDFQARFGIDYSQFPVKPIGIREVHRLIWHTQLSTHNGGDFFNEILYGHPNLLAYESVMFDKMEELIHQQREQAKDVSLKSPSYIVRELAQIPNPTDKDCLVTLFLNSDTVSGDIRGNSRIVPALLFQPHFSNVLCRIDYDQPKNQAILTSDIYQKISHSPLFRQFKYIKTFTPIRRPTTSYGATVRFMSKRTEEEGKKHVITDVFTERLLNRTFMVDQWDRLFRDSMLVRFEDGKLNPQATFTALAEFLDIPYTESMTYCSGQSGLNPESLPGNDLGFDPAAIYRTYDEYVNDDDRFLLEYFMRDIYETYGYDFHYYHGETVDMELINEKLKGFHHLDHAIFQSYKDATERNFAVICDDEVVRSTEQSDRIAQEYLERYAKNRMRVIGMLMQTPRFVNADAQPLRLMKKLKLNPALLEQPVYH